MFLDGQKLHPYIPIAETMDFTGAVDKKKSMSNSICIGKTFVLYTRYNTDKSKYYIGVSEHK